MCAYIFTVPLGPKFDFITSWIPLAAEIFMAKAWEALATSALGFNKLMAIFFHCEKLVETTGLKQQNSRKEEWKWNL